MDDVLLRKRPLWLALLLTAAGSALAGPQPAGSSLELQSRSLRALTAMANEASPHNAPSYTTLSAGKLLAMTATDPALVPAGSAGMGAMEESLSVCSNGQSAGEQLFRLALATPDPEETIEFLSVAVDNVAIMSVACSARQLDMMGHELLRRGAGSDTAAVLEGMQQMVDGMITRIALLALAATQTDRYSPSDRAMTLASALPILREVAPGLPPDMRQKALDAIERALQKPGSDGHIDREARARLEAALRHADCTASCKVLGQRAPTAP